MYCKEAHRCELLTLVFRCLGFINFRLIDQLFTENEMQVHFICKYFTQHGVTTLECICYISRSICISMMY